MSVIIGYALLSIALTYIFGFLGMWSFGMASVPNFSESRLLFPSLIFSGDENVWATIFRHALLSGIIYASLAVSIMLIYRAIKRFKEES